MPDTASIAANHLLACLAPDERARVAKQLDSVELSLGEAVQHTGEPLQYTYFPTSSVLSLLRSSESGDTVEVALTGAEGVAGVTAFLGDGRSSSTVVAKRAGHAFRCPRRTLREEVRHCPRLENALLRYVQSLVAQLAQTALCNRLHNSDGRLCRCLLQLHDRQQSNHLELTHEFLSHILGMRRVGVTEALQALQNAGAITMSRGCIKVVNRALLEDCACECYRIISEETERLTPVPYKAN